MKTMLESCAAYAGRILWTFFGVAIGLSLIAFGFWRTLLLAALGASGWLIGLRRDKPERFAEAVDTVARKIKRS